MPLPSLETALMLALLVATFVVFFMEILPIEVTAFGLLAVLVAVGIVDIDQALAGFSNKAVITVGCMFVLSHALVKTGILNSVANRLSGSVAGRPWLGIAALIGTVGVLSGFLNNTAVVAIFIPLAIDLCRRLKISPSKVLIPISYASIFGGTLTLIGTSTNLLVSSLAEQAGHAPLAMFELTRLGMVLVPIGLLYVLIVAPRVLPARAGTGSLTRKYHMASYLSELRIQQDSPLIGKSCKDARMGAAYDVIVLEIIRGDTRIGQEIQDVPLQEGDILIVRGAFSSMLRLRSDHRVALLSDVKLREEEFAAAGAVVVEALVPPTSALIGSTLTEVGFRRKYGAFVLALRRHGATLRSKVARIPIHLADTLLMLVPRHILPDLRQSEDMIILSEVEMERARGRFWWAVLILIPLVVLLAASGVVEITKGALLATTVLLVLRVVTPRECYRTVDWSVLLLIAAFVPVGKAMVDTGTAQFVGAGILSLRKFVPAEWGYNAAVSLTYLVTSVLTQMVSNNATAIIMVPVATSVAGALGADPRAFLVTVCFAASAEFMTPMGYQTNMMVYGPGSYRFLDYTRLGAPLNVTFWILASLLIPLLW